MAFKRCMVIDVRWKRKRLSRCSPLDELMRSTAKDIEKVNGRAVIRTPVFSTAIGWKRYDCDNTEC